MAGNPFGTKATSKVASKGLGVAVLLPKVTVTGLPVVGIAQAWPPVYTAFVQALNRSHPEPFR